MGAIESSRHHTVDLLSVSVFLLVRRRRWRKNFVSTSNQTHLELDPPPGPRDSEADPHGHEICVFLEPLAYLARAGLEGRCDTVCVRSAGRPSEIVKKWHWHCNPNQAKRKSQIKQGR